MKIGMLADERKMCYNTLNYFLAEIAKSLQQRGIEVQFITKIDLLAIQQRFDAFIGLNRPEPALQSSDGSFLLDRLGIPFFNLLVDAPYYHSGSLKSHAADLHLIFLDSGHVKYCQKYYMPCKSVEMGYLIGPAGTPIPYEDRALDLLFTGGCYDYTHIKEEFLSDQKPAEIRDIFSYLIDSGIHSPEYTTEALILSYLHSDQTPVNAEVLDFLMREAGVWAEYYLRGYYRERVVRSLAEAGLRMTIAGGGWGSVFPKCPPNLTLLGEVNMTETADLTANTKILLNVMPWFKDGLHDRILTAMYNGAICVTDPSSYIKTHFQADKNIVLYELNALEQVPNQCRYLLEHPDKARKIAQAGQQKAETEYNWDHFVDSYILKWL